MKIPYQFADAGSPKAERNDCSVRALALSTRVGYEKAHGWMEKFGRKSGKGVKYPASDRAYEECGFGGYKIKKIYQLYQDERPRTLNWFLKNYEFPKRCMIRVRGHIFAMVNGTVLDHEPPRLRKHLISVWEVAKPKPVV